jgi:ketosteroid isomerase-like protein
MMNTQDIAKDFTDLCARGAYEEAGEKHWADHIVSIEAMDGPMARVEGRAAVKAKGDWWNNAHEMHSASAHGPYVNGDQFAVRFVMDVTNKESGERMQMDEVGVYTVKNGKIVEERFYY